MPRRIINFKLGRVSEILLNLSMFSSKEMESGTGFGLPLTRLHLSHHFPARLWLPRSSFHLALVQPNKVQESRSAIMGHRTGYLPKALVALTMREDGSPPRKIEKVPKLSMQRRIPSFTPSRGLQQNMVAEIQLGESAGRVCWEWPCEFLFHHISLFKPVLLKVLDSTGEMVSTFIFSHRSSSSCVIPSIPSRWGIFSFYYCIIHVLGFWNWTWNMPCLPLKFKIQMQVNYREKILCHKVKINSMDLNL